MLFASYMQLLINKMTITFFALNYKLIAVSYHLSFGCSLLFSYLIAFFTNYLFAYTKRYFNCVSVSIIPPYHNIYFNYFNQSLTFNLRIVNKVIIKNDTNKLILGKNGITYTNPIFHNSIKPNDNINPTNGNINMKLP